MSKWKRNTPPSMTKKKRSAPPIWRQAGNLITSIVLAYLCLIGKITEHQALFLMGAMIALNTGWILDRQDVL